jgi:hypothetical protein
MAGKKSKLFKARKPRPTPQNDCLDGGLPAPNHAHHPSLVDITDDPFCNQDSAGVPTFPMMMLAKPESEGAGHASTLAFLDERYGVKKWAELMVYLDLCKECTRKGVQEFLRRPPSWMDPEVFVRMVDKNPRTRKIVQMYLKKGHSGQRLRMNEMLQEVFEEEYLVYMLEQFTEVRDLLAQWVIAHYAEEERNAATKKRKRKPASSA